MTIWRSLLTVEELNAGRAGTILEHIGVEFTQIGDDFVRGTMPVDGRTRQPYGLLHGGASVALAESLGSTGASMCIDTEQYQCVGQEINANHLRPARSGYVTGTARPVHLGGRTHVWGIEIANEAGKLVCVSRLTVAVIRRGSLGR
jgi:1,4-dihydroxy-2-naphthoyl-CoA hydrolase